MIRIFRRFKAIDYSKVPKLNEQDLLEKFISGSGPGGSAVNKSQNCVFLKHIPTGLLVKCHQQRDIDHNRKIAREILTTKLDNLINGSMSVQAQKQREENRKLMNSERKRAKLKLLKEQWKINENIQ